MVFEAGSGHLLYDSLLPFAMQIFAQKVFQVNTVGIENFHNYFLWIKEWYVLFDGCTFTGSRTQHDDTSLGSLFHHCNAVVARLFLSLFAQRVRQHFAEGCLIGGIEARIEGFLERFNNRLLLVFNWLSDMI